MKILINIFFFFNKMINFIDGNKKNRIIKMVHEDDKNRLLLAEALLRLIVCRKLDLRNDQIRLKQTKFGKPYLDLDSELHFNISHSGDWVVCAIDRQSVGVDVQEIIDIEYKEIAQNYFTEEEYLFIMNESLTNQLKKFYWIWTLKESYIKADGKGLSIPLKSFSFHISNPNDIKMLTSNRLKECYFKLFNIAPNYVMSACNLNNHFPNQITYLNQHDLINDFMKLCSQK
ncbi:4'-phosphopantetheinyl transferase superfamily protein [Bacillus aquiflavi]|uniref:4'-phosphopantetheinyl transferase family protein n=1 Tax=Bacillus aquiflavi TaxID=2672567 RepID=UPI001CA9FC8A|nr:4'-phosphopantetheinyl transferase superfamily protein [Bacillus aquiflavi]UAC49646.1 4'-phosphopantetheinyl transferase superfamily protein [Bacillus aquiflavi]